MQTFVDMRTEGVGVRYRGKYVDVLYERPLKSRNHSFSAFVVGQPYQAVESISICCLLRSLKPGPFKFLP